MSEWQSIETAPKDGTWMLCWSEGFEHPTVGAYRTYKQPKDEKYWSVCGVWFVEGKGPTHWMPLPKPPEVT